MQVLPFNYFQHPVTKFKFNFFLSGNIAYGMNCKESGENSFSKNKMKKIFYVLNGKCTMKHKVCKVITA